MKEIEEPNNEKSEHGTDEHSKPISDLQAYFLSELFTGEHEFSDEDDAISVILNTFS